MTESITALVNSENKGDRIKALNMLRELEPAIAFGYIKQLVTDNNTRVGALKLTAAFDDLQHLYETTSEWLIQFSIIAALGELGEPRGLGLLQTALTSETALVQTAAIGAIGELGDPNGVESIIPFVTHPDWQIRYQLARSLRALGGDLADRNLAILATDSIEQVANEAQGK